MPQVEQPVGPFPRELVERVADATGCELVERNGGMIVTAPLAGRLRDFKLQLLRALTR